MPSPMTAFEVFDWLEQTAIGTAIRDSAWLFPVVEAVHLLGLALLGGAVLLLDLRLLGLGLRSKSVRYVFEQTRPWLLGAIALMVATGVPLFLSESVKCYFSSAFWVKMGGLTLALLFTFGVRNRAAGREPAPSPLVGRLVGLSSMSLWLTVAAAGRWIGFS